MNAGIPTVAPSTSRDVRDRLIDALRLDLVGPWAGHPSENERLWGWERPSQWYLTGFLIPAGTPPDKRGDADEDDDFDDIAETGGLAEESTEDRKAAKKGYFPSSMGLSFLVPPHVESLSVKVRWGDFVKSSIVRGGEEEAEGEPGVEGAGEGDAEGGAGKVTPIWQRIPREKAIAVPLHNEGKLHAIDVPDSSGLQLIVVARAVTAQELIEHIPAGARSVSLFLVNHRPPNEDQRDLSYAFQAEIEVRCSLGFVPRPDLRGAWAEEWDEQVADLHYAGTPEYATGHGVSADWEIIDGTCHLLRTTWVPGAEVEKTETAAVPGVELSMDALGALPNGAAANAALKPIVGEYRSWINARRNGLSGLQGNRKETAEELLRLADLAANRIEKGIDLLSQDAEALDAFRVANRAVSRALKKRLRITTPEWRAFQLAYILLNLHGDRRPARPGPADGRSALFPDRRRQDGSLSRACRLYDGAETAPSS